MAKSVKFCKLGEDMLRKTVTFFLFERKHTKYTAESTITAWEKYTKIIILLGRLGMVTIHALMCVACIENMMCMRDVTQHSNRIKVYPCVAICLVCCKPGLTHCTR